MTGGATVGVLAAPWAEAARRDGQLLQMVIGAPGTSVDDRVWGDIIIYVPDAAYSTGTTAPEPMPADPVAWTTSHANLEILDQREITVDGVAATQIDARATTRDQLAGRHAEGSLGNSRRMHPGGAGGRRRICVGRRLTCC